jgi:hypothetical protein
MVHQVEAIGKRTSCGTGTLDRTDTWRVRWTEPSSRSLQGLEIFAFGCFPKAKKHFLNGRLGGGRGTVVEHSLSYIVTA